MRKNQKGFGFIYLVLGIAIVALLVGFSWSVFLKTGQQEPNVSDNSTSVSEPDPCKEQVNVELKEEVTLGTDCFIKIIGIDLEIGIARFFNDPCPADVDCFWSGVGIEFEYRLMGETTKVMDSQRAFGYKANVLETDHVTYARISIEKVN